MRSRSSGEQAADVIRRRIFDGGLRPGDRVPQDEIAAALGVSRIPVREALIALEREGWVRIEIHRGAFINAFDEDALRDHYELYAVVYGHAGRRALERDPATLLPRLREIHDQLLRTDDPEEIGRSTVAFNAALVDAAHSSRVKVVLRSMTGLVPGDFFAMVSGAVHAARRGCTAVLGAMEEGDGDAVEEAYTEMMKAMGDEVVSVFRARGLLDGVTDVMSRAGGATDE